MPAPSIRKPSAALAAALALALGLTGCSPASDEADPATPAAPAATTAPEAAPGAQAAEAVQATAEALATLTAEDLREKGNAALRDQRLYSPAGENAMEYYLALRQKSEQPDVSAESALIDLMPYALIASEQAINDQEFGEAERLLELMARTDPEAPSLSRIRDAIASGRTAAADRVRLDAERTERERLAAEQRARQEAAATAPTPAPTPTPAPDATATAAAPEPAPAVVEPPPAPVVATPTPAAPPAAAAPAPARTAAPRPISTPQPPYPREAARSRASGMVVVQYTIGADGRVTDVIVLRSRPRGLFERTVQDTVATWRFEAPGEPVTQTRTFDFRM